MADSTDMIRSSYAAFSNGHMPAVLGALAAYVHWTEAEGFTHGGTYIGPDAVLQNVFLTLGTE